MNANINRSVSKAESDKLMVILQNILKDEDNRYCVDCDAKAPRWASWNLGVFLCIRCAGIHRNLGVHISKVKSVNLDTWTPEQVAYVKDMGNSRARAIYEANIPDNFRRPQTDAALEQFIRAKYEHHKYIAREWRAPPKPNVELIMKELSSVGSGSSRSVVKKPVSTVENRDSTSLVKAPLSNDTPGLSKAPSAAKVSVASTALSSTTDPPQSVAAVDLLGINAPISSSATKQTTPVASLSADDLFGDFTGAAMQSPISSGNSSAGSNNGLDFNIFNNNPTTANTVHSTATSNGDGSAASSNSKSTKESILALYGNSACAPPVQNQWEQQMLQHQQQHQFLGRSGAQQPPASSNPYAILGGNQFQDGNQLFGSLAASTNNHFSAMPLFNGGSNAPAPAFNNPFFTPQQPPPQYQQTQPAPFPMFGQSSQDEVLRQHALSMNQQAVALQQQQQQAYLTQIQNQLSGMQLSASSAGFGGISSSVSLGNLASPGSGSGVVGGYNMVGAATAIGGGGHTASATNLWQ